MTNVFTALLLGLAGANLHAEATLLLSQIDDGMVNEMKGRIIAALPRAVRVAHVGAKSVWVQDWFPRLWSDDRGLVAVLPRGLSTNDADQDILRRTLVARGVRVADLRLPTAGGNIVELGDVVVVADADDKLPPPHELRSHFARYGRNVVLIEATPRERTGHADLIVAPAGDRRVVVADSRDQARRAAYDRAAECLRRGGYEVVRVGNGGPDVAEAVLSYVNVVHVGRMVLVPAYAGYVESLVERVPKLVARNWWAHLVFGARLAERPEDFVPMVADDDRRALELWQSLGFDARPVELNASIEFAGSLHCMSYLVPAELRHVLPTEPIAF